MSFDCGKWSAGICVPLGAKHSSTYSSEYASGFFELAALHLPTASSLRNKEFLGQAPKRDAKHETNWPCTDQDAKGNYQLAIVPE